MEAGCCETEGCVISCTRVPWWLFLLGRLDSLWVRFGGPFFLAQRDKVCFKAPRVEARSRYMEQARPVVIRQHRTLQMFLAQNYFSGWC